MKGEEYNALTKKLLAEGYTADHYPDHVQIAAGQTGNHPLQNLSGGFEYKPWYADEIVYQTGCGRYFRGFDVISDMHYMGTLWSHENGNPLIKCPESKGNCPKNDQRLWENGQGMDKYFWCVCHQTEEQ